VSGWTCVVTTLRGCRRSSGRGFFGSHARASSTSWLRVLHAWGRVNEVTLEHSNSAKERKSSVLGSYFIVVETAGIFADTSRQTLAVMIRRISDGLAKIHFSHACKTESSFSAIHVASQTINSSHHFLGLSRRHNRSSKAVLVRF